MLNQFIQFSFLCLVFSRVNFLDVFDELDGVLDGFLKEMFFDGQENYLLVRLKNTFYHYCGINKQVIKTWVNSSSLGRYYLNNIKGNYDCRVYPLPNYE